MRLNKRLIMSALGVAFAFALGAANVSAQGCSGTCTIVYDGTQYQIQVNCPNPNQCYCVIPVVSGGALCAPKDCVPNPTPGDKSFIVAFDSQNSATQRCFMFEVPDEEPTAAFTMSPVNIDLGGGAYWTVNVTYDSAATNAHRVAPSVIVVPEPFPATSKVTIGYKGGNFNKISHFNATGINTREYSFKRFHVRITRTFPPPP